MIFAKQSTSVQFTVGPVLDADGAFWDGAVVADFFVSKLGAAPVALGGGAAATYGGNGWYQISTDPADINTVGAAEFVLQNGENACPIKELQVLEPTVYDAVIASGATGKLPATLDAGDVTGVLPVNVLELLGTAWLTPAVAGTPDVNTKTFTDNALTANVTSSTWLTELRSYLFGQDVAAQFDASGYHKLSPGTGTGQFDLTSGVGKANVTAMAANVMTAAAAAADFGTEMGSAVLAAFSGKVGAMANDGSATLQLSQIKLVCNIADEGALQIENVHADGIGMSVEGNAYGIYVDSSVGRAIYIESNNADGCVEIVNGTGTALRLSGTTYGLLAEGGTADILTANSSAVIKGNIWVKDSSGNPVAPASDTTAIRAKTDNLPASPAAVGSAMTLATDALNAAALAASALVEMRTYFFGQDVAAQYDVGGYAKQSDGTGQGQIGLTGGYVDGIAGTLHTLDALLTSLVVEHDATQATLALVKTKTDQMVFTNTNKLDSAILAAADWATIVGEKQADITLRRPQASVFASVFGSTPSKGSLFGFIQQAQKSDAGITTAGKITIKNPDGTTLGTLDITSNVASAPITSVA